MIDRNYKNYVNSLTIEQLKAMLNRMDKEKFPEHLKFIQDRIEQLNGESNLETEKQGLPEDKSNQNINQSPIAESKTSKDHYIVESYETKQYKKVRIKLILYLLYYLISIALTLFFLKNYINSVSSLFFYIVGVLILKVLVSLSLVNFLRKRTVKLKNRILTYLMILICIDISYLAVLFFQSNFDFSILTGNISNLSFIINILLYFYLRSSEQVKKYFESYVV